MANIPLLRYARNQVMENVEKLVPRYSAVEHNILRAFGVDKDGPEAVYREAVEKIQTEFRAAVERAFDDLKLGKEGV